MATGKTIALTRRTFVGKVMSLLFNMLSAAAKSLQSCPTLCDPTDGSPQGSSVPGILQASILEWVAISFSECINKIELFFVPVWYCTFLYKLAFLSVQHYSKCVLSNAF